MIGLTVLIDNLSEDKILLDCNWGCCWSCWGWDCRVPEFLTIELSLLILQIRFQRL